MLIAAEHTISYLHGFSSPVTLLHVRDMGQEIRYTLMTFGLPADAAFPSIAHDEDAFSLENHIDWLPRREKPLEACLDNNSDKGEEWKITEPGPFDVVMSRASEAQIHLESIRYRNIIAERQQVYEKSLIHETTAIAKGIVRLIKESGDRVLQQNGRG
jgi:hypothetical protein